MHLAAEIIEINLWDYGGCKPPVTGLSLNKSRRSAACIPPPNSFPGAQPLHKTWLSIAVCCYNICNLNSDVECYNLLGCRCVCLFLRFLCSPCSCNILRTSSTNIKHEVAQHLIVYTSSVSPFIWSATSSLSLFLSLSLSFSPLIFVLSLPVLRIAGVLYFTLHPPLLLLLLLLPLLPF